MNFTFQDLFGSFLAFLIFPSILLCPGYLLSWIVNLFDFKQRRTLTRHIIGVLVSAAITPILFYLIAFYISFYAVKWTILFFLTLYVFIALYEMRNLNNRWQFGMASRYQQFIFWVAVGWVTLSILSLVDIQWGSHLYNNVVALDFATRATVVHAITRTGVPPVNPSYFPGGPEHITSLYYFWYILCSVIDQLGGKFVDARMALIAGDIWCGLTLMALVALYIRIRNNVTGVFAQKMAFIGISLLAVSGLDIIPASLVMLGSRISYGFMWPYGDIEHWNEQITAWVGSLFWVPHHVAAMIVCVAGFMIFQYYRNSPLDKRISAAIVAGFAFASAVGLSVWITVTFSVFLGVWSIVLLVWNKDKGTFLLLILSGLVALLVASPFLLGLLKGEAGGGIPFALEIRRFRPAIPFVDALPPIPQSIIYMFLLPINYFMELGFFFIVAVLWLRKYWNRELPPSHFLIPEIILLCGVVFLGSFIRSTATASNDFGWRAWLFGQFVLLVWAVDLNGSISFLPKIHRFLKTNLIPKKADLRKLMAFTLVIGFLTTMMDIALLRFWPVLVDMNIAGFPNSLSPDRRLGERTFDARLTYEFINKKLPVDIVIQQNPLSKVDQIDRPSGLYGNRQFAISFSAPYNVPFPFLKMRANQISKIFDLEHQDSWDTIDLLCQQYFIDILIVTDQDLLWGNLSLLYQQRTALYMNRYYAVLPCGTFRLPKDDPVESTP